MTINITTVKSALVSLAIAAVVAVAIEILKVGDVFALDWKVLVNTAVITGIASVLKSLGTNNKGVFGGVVKVK